MKDDNNKKNIIIYNTIDGKASVSLYAKDGMIWMNQSQLAELFDTSKQNIGQHFSSILKDNELNEISVVKNYFTTAADGKEYDVSLSEQFFLPTPQIFTKTLVFFESFSCNVRVVC